MPRTARSDVPRPRGFRGPMRTVDIICTLPWGPEGVRIMLAALCTANVFVMSQLAAAGRPLPQLYRSGVVYRRQAGPERFRLAPDVYARRGGDCDQLCCWRVAELRLAGETGARAIPKVINPKLIHVVVRRADGSIEDPSKRLGMGKS